MVEDYQGAAAVIEAVVVLGVTCFDTFDEVLVGDQLTVELVHVNFLLGTFAFNYFRLIYFIVRHLGLLYVLYLEIDNAIIFYLA